MFVEFISEDGSTVAISVLSIRNFYAQDNTQTVIEFIFQHARILVKEPYSDVLRKVNDTLNR